jgi:hypothetical protein
MSRKRLSDVVNSIFERALCGERIDARAEAVASWNDIDEDGQYMAGIEGVTDRIKNKTRSIRASTSARISESQPELPFNLPAVVAMDLDGHELCATRSLSREQFVRAIEIREQQIAADAAALREWRKALTAAERIWSLHPDWNFGRCLDAIAVSIRMPEMAK